MKLFLTGATGFVGGELARQLVAAGHELVVVVRSPEKAQPLADLGVTVHQGDITVKESMRAPMTGVDGVFHLAAWYEIGVKDTRRMERINVQGTLNVLELMAELQIPKGVYTSTLGVFSDTHGEIKDETYRYDGPFLNAYERTKWEAHYDVALPLMKAGLPLVIVMPGLIYGPGDTSQMGEQLVQFLRGRLPAIPTTTAFCWAHVEDIARGHILAFEQGTPGESYIIAGESATVVEGFEIAARVSGIPAPRFRLNPGLLRGMAALVGTLDRVLPMPQTYSAESLRTIAGVTYLGTNAKARRELGYDPRPLNDGWGATVRHEMERLGIQPG